MGEQVEHVYDIPMEDHNASNHEYSTLTKVWNSKHGELNNASRKRDRLMIVLGVMQLICLSVAVASIVMYVSGSFGTEDKPKHATDGKDYIREIGDKYLIGTNGQVCIKGPKVEKCLNGDKGLMGDKGPLGDKGAVGIKGQNGEKGSHGEIGIIGLVGPTGSIGQPGSKGAHGQKGEKGSQGESGKPLTCSNGWVQFMSSCYYFQFRNVKTWSAAKDDCHRKGGFLVKIDNAVEDWFLKTYIKTDHPISIWIGATDSDRESHFVWESDNLPLTFTDWYPGEPNDINNEDCVQMRESENYTWNDFPCSFKRSYICEKQ